MNLKIFLIKKLLQVIGFFKGEKYNYSLEYEDNFKYMDVNEKVWWGYKALVKQIENGEKNKGIEEYFKKQDLNFEDDYFISEKKITLTAGGDLSCTEVAYPESTKKLWDDVEKFYFNSDIVCANLESPIDENKPISGVPSVCLTAPNLNNSSEMFDIFSRGGKGINFFATANNHSFDQGEDGIIATLDFLDLKGYTHVGTSRCEKEQMDIPIIEKNGIRIAMLSYTYCLNGHDLPNDKEYMVNVIRLNKLSSDISLIKKHIEIAHEKKADIIIAHLHWSIEFETYPIENIIKMGHKIMESGVDIILGGHPHVAQPMEKYEFIDPYTNEYKDGFIIYSLGELVSYNAFSKNSRLALLLKLKISKGKEQNKEKTKITELKVLPIYTYVKKNKNKQWDYRVLDFIKLMNQLKCGENSFDFSEREIKELKRLEDLLYEKILPEKSNNIIQDTLKRGCRCE